MLFVYGFDHNRELGGTESEGFHRCMAGIPSLLWRLEWVPGEMSIPVHGSDMSVCRMATISIENSTAVLKREPLSCPLGITLQDSYREAASGGSVLWAPYIWKLQGPTIYFSGNIFLSSESYYPGRQSSQDHSLPGSLSPYHITHFVSTMTCLLKEAMKIPIRQASLPAVLSSTKQGWEERPLHNWNTCHNNALLP